MFDVSLRDKGFTNVHTFQAMSYEDFKAWFAIMEGKELTPVLSLYSNKTDPSCKQYNSSHEPLMLTRLPFSYPIRIFL